MKTPAKPIAVGADDAALELKATLMKVDDELKALIDVEAESMGLTQLSH
jgi:hypothetical protein